MTLFALAVSQEEAAIRSSIEGLRALFAIVLALAFGEAFKQFVSDKAEKPEDQHIHWWRLPALVAFVVLLVPFSHGMARYFADNYQEATRPRPYSTFLLIDSVIFTIESVLFFVLSRSLPREQWRRFYWTVLLLLVIDIGWGTFTAWHHAPRLWCWALVNVATVVVMVPMMFFFRKHNSLAGPITCMSISAIRTVADYTVSFSLYFPPQP